MLKSSLLEEVGPALKELVTKSNVSAITLVKLMSKVFSTAIKVVGLTIREVSVSTSPYMYES